MDHQNIIVNPEGNTMSYIYPSEAINENYELNGNGLTLLSIELCH